MPSQVSDLPGKQFQPATFNPPTTFLLIEMYGTALDRVGLGQRPTEYLPNLAITMSVNMAAMAAYYINS